MNVIVIVNDSMRRDHLGCYGNPWIKTPHLDALAANSAVFERAYIASHATLPARIDLLTGRYTFLQRGWSPLQPGDVILPEVLGRHGCASMFIFDTPPLGQDGGNFMRGFSGWEMIRGQHEDRWRTDPTGPIPWPAAPHKLKNLGRTAQYFRNRADWRDERDYVTPRTFQAAMDWLDRNHTLDPFLLWIDAMDPHEPFDPPPEDRDLYARPGYDGDAVIYPQYGRSTYMTDAELDHVRALYAGEVTLVDRWIGHLVDRVEQLGLSDRTLIIHTSDHGHLFGEHGLQGKPGGLLGNLYEETTRLPLIIHHPQGLGAGKRVADIVQPPDLMPTILEFLGVPAPASVQGRSLWPSIRGDSPKEYTYAFSGRFPPAVTRSSKAWTSEGSPPGRGAAGQAAEVEALTVTSADWALVAPPWGRQAELYDLQSDRAQNYNVIASHLDVAAEMHQALLDFMSRFGAPSGLVGLFNQPTAQLAEPVRRPQGRLATEEPLYTFRDREGRKVAFSSQAEAHRRLATLSVALEREDFGSVLAHDPRSLIHLDGQYYWAQDLI
jgi:arylsulfatase A-like enzyme